MSLALGKIAIPVAIGLIAVLAGSGKAKADTKSAYDAGYAAGKTDKENGKAANTFETPKTDNERAYVKGYADGYAAGVVKGGGGGANPPKPQYNGKDTETITQAQGRGNAQGLADGRQDGSFGNPMGTTRTKPSYTRTDLINAYWNAWNPAYNAGYVEGKEIKDAGGGGIMGDVLGTQGDRASNFRPMQSARHYYDAKRPAGYPKSWYNM